MRLQILHTNLGFAASPQMSIRLLAEIIKWLAFNKRKLDVFTWYKHQSWKVSMVGQPIWDFRLGLNRRLRCSESLMLPIILSLCCCHNSPISSSVLPSALFVCMNTFLAEALRAPGLYWLGNTSDPEDTFCGVSLGVSFFVCCSIFDFFLAFTGVSFVFCSVFDLFGVFTGVSFFVFVSVFDFFGAFSFCSSSRNLNHQRNIRCNYS